MLQLVYAYPNSATCLERLPKDGRQSISGQHFLVQVLFFEIFFSSLLFHKRKTNQEIENEREKRGRFWLFNEGEHLREESSESPEKIDAQIEAEETHIFVFRSLVFRSPVEMRQFT